MTSTIRRLHAAQSRGAILATALLLSSGSASIAKAATITLSSTCTFAKAVKSINNQSTQSGCTRSGSYGSGDTVNVPAGTFNIDVGVNVTRSMTIHGAGKNDAYLQAVPGISNVSQNAIQIGNPNIVVKIDNLSLIGENIVMGIFVDGENDTNLNDNNLELNQVQVSSFGDSGLYNLGGRVLVQNSDFYVNSGTYGGGISNTNVINENGTWGVGSLVVRYSYISLNSATYGGAIYNSGKLDVRSSHLGGNYASSNGGAIFMATTVSNASCSVRRDSPTAPQSTIDSNTAGQGGYSIISTTVACNLYTTTGNGNTSPYCSSNVTGCPQ